MMIDIDHFKRINDSYGHATGDEVLRRFAAIAQKATREDDIVARSAARSSRWCWRAPTSRARCSWPSDCARRWRAAALPTSGQQYSMTASIGVVVIDPKEHINSALARADQALYAAKSAGRDRVEIGECGCA